ncbi:hypothetical protein HOLleu_09351 [Holothuria leucospilota]|uniref:Tyr recombinase domain-containing protein n=1 Tax=Holothuria leucospilota TaxID=206669 RepID=A0A9Q1CC53_HOLLE|nr:hypothetical protein HOLleu_09351 [Holothuria leucospilota]
MWTQKLECVGWSPRAIQQFPFCLAPSTLLAYNAILRKLQDFCHSKQAAFPPVDTQIVAQFLCDIADCSSSPRSQLKVALAAMAHMFDNFGFINVCECYHIKMLVEALVKSGTKKPMHRSQVMPIAPFRELFTRWPNNDQLSIKDLRLKTITLMALVLMLRPSDIAPKSVQFDVDGSHSEFVFSLNHVVFMENEAHVTFHGIKNDTTRTGFSVVLQATNDDKLNPVKALKAYIDRTENVRPVNDPVFLTLSPPYRAIAAGTVAAIMNEAIKRAGLEGMGFSAKSFRPTGATAAVDMHCDPDIAMKQGRWKTRSVFFEHYVHSKPPATLATSILEEHQ